MLLKKIRPPAKLKIELLASKYLNNKNNQLWPQNCSKYDFRRLFPDELKIDHPSSVASIESDLSFVSANQRYTVCP
ncbi:hypothetical protein [Candidiatus Paracoxiella cheracis]|uniref:hypothetical protein n=1 Tax=Candidiatus Paracoxiella cheracis TaxID=3405120 RepID=UPI003BF523B1